MSFDDYANHIYQKHRLCVALVIIKTKPWELTTQEYFKQLQTKMADSIDIDDVTVCSDDFNADYTDGDDSFNILRDFHENNFYNQVAVRDDNQGYEDIETTPSLLENLTQTTYYNSQSTSAANIKTISYLDEQNIIHGNDRNLKNSNNYYTKNLDITNIHKINEKASLKLNTNNTKTAEHINTVKDNHKDTEISDTNVKNTINNMENNTEYDSQKTIPYTLYGFTQNDSYISQSQSQMYIPNKYLYAFNNKHIENKENTFNDNLLSIENGQETTKMKVDKIQEKQVFKENVKTTGFSTNVKFNKNNETANNVNTSQNSEVENLTLILNEDNDVTNIILENSLQLNNYFDEMNTFNSNTLSDNNNFENTKDFSQNSGYNQNNTDINYFDAELANINTVNLKDEVNKMDDTPQKIALSQNFERKMFFSELKSKPIFMEEVDTNISELIPYKVLEELNKIKIYLRRKERRMSVEGYTTDSGYRSDSQSSRTFRNSLQSSGTSINQSAYCLFNHILQCPLVAATRDITMEIAQTLSDLIDRLHDEEIYPPFLEELLDTVDILIRQIYKSKNINESEFLNKDEFMQRTLLLNRSIHIQTHCIEKITTILVSFHEKITDISVTYELTNLDEIENITYIFHILEILIKKYTKNKNILSQTSTQMSQEEDKILKKSSITDIWRKKWYPNIQENHEGSYENRCIIKSCSDILNKIIVDCMNSYSLIAYSALKCFNTMQS